MSLPIISQPNFELTIPSNSKVITFRPFLVKEEKILLIAVESDNQEDILRAMKQVIANCVKDEDFNINEITTFDLEYIFLKIRAKSVNNIVKVSYRDTEDEEIRDFSIDLDDIEIEMPKDIQPKIKINDEVGLIMKYPSSNIIEKLREFENEIDLNSFIITNCIDTIYTKDEVFEAKDYSEDELNNFIDSIPPKVYDKMNDFFKLVPKLTHTIKYTNKMGNEREIVLSTVKDFFSWG